MLFQALLLAVAVLGTPLEEQYEAYKLQFHKVYTNKTENHLRFKYFVASLERVERLNEANPQSPV